MDIYEFYHSDWNDYVQFVTNKNILFRLYNVKELGNYTINDNFLIINWNNWDKEYFYKNNRIYYQITNNDKFQLNLYFSEIILIKENYYNNCFIDNNLKKIYEKNELIFYGFYNFNEYKLIIDKEIFIFFNFKFYERSYFLKYYNVIKIIEENNNIVNYVLNEKDKICYENYNIFKKYNYNIYNKYLKINKNNTENIYKNEKSNNYRIIKNSINNLLLNNDNYDTLLEICLEKNIEIFMKDETNFKDIIKSIEYLNNFNIKNYVIDNIGNKNNNTIYLDINFIYYENNEILENFIKKIKLRTINNFQYLINYNLINELYIKNIWYSLNNNNLEKYEILFNSEKLIHFIWIGNNKIPDIYIEYIESWIKKHSNYKFCFWNDENIPLLINQTYYDNAKTYAMKADILRYELLYFFGGIYIDTDFLCIKNIDKLICKYDGFSGYESAKYIAIGLMGFKKYDNILYNIIKNISYNIIINSDNNKSIPELTGPIYFTEMWKAYCNDKHYSFSQNYFYIYSFQDKINKRKYTINNDTYAIHTWGYSWKKDNSIMLDDEYYITKLYLNRMIIENNNFKGLKYKIKYNEVSNYLKNRIIFSSNTEYDNKIKVVNIIGVFFSGGIEKYIHYIDKYGNHEKYLYYLLYISNDSYVYEINNMIMISYDWNHNHLNNLLININPNIIIDHYSLYINDNNVIYKNINRNKIIYFVHSAIVYKNDISKLYIDNCIHLYKENFKDDSWNNINNNYYVTLGTEISYENCKNKNIGNLNHNKNKINISIIGRIAEEKIPILFFEKLCKLSNIINDYAIINIYGMKDEIFNKEYVEKFNKLINNSKIIYNNFVDHNEIYKIYNNTNILLIPSSYETGSFTCIEAFYYGIPVICRNNYGLKLMVKNGVTGYLCNSDEEILDKILNIKRTMIFNSEIIKKESFKYNIIDKIYDLENIIYDFYIEKKYKTNIIIITSVINNVISELSYYPIRSVFSINERYEQTLQSIKSIKDKIPKIEILFCECSDLSEHKDLENNIKNNVTYYFNFYEDEFIRTNVNSKLKGYGEASILLKGINELLKIKNKYKNIFKLSGRYYLDNNFNYSIFNNNKNIFSNWDNSCESYCTIFYKINSDDIIFFKNALKKSLEHLKNNNSIEECIYQNFTININIIDKLNVCGLLATEGYFIEV
jgi:mannosyltransferase OCH1-like enzyme